MKDIKTFIIGFLTCTCIFLIMGQTKTVDKDGTFDRIVAREIFVSNGINDDGKFITIQPSKIQINEMNKETGEVKQSMVLNSGNLLSSSKLNDNFFHLSLNEGDNNTALIMPSVFINTDTHGSGSIALFDKNKTMIWNQPK